MAPNKKLPVQKKERNVLNVADKIATFKSYYLRKVLKNMLRFENQHRDCDGFISENVVRSFWKNFPYWIALDLLMNHGKKYQSQH